VSLARRARPEALLEEGLELLEAALRNSERPEELPEEALRDSERPGELLEAGLEEALRNSERPGELPDQALRVLQHAWPTCLSASAGMRSTPPPTRG